MEHSLLFPIEKMCKVLKVKRNTYYHWQKRSESRYVKENKEITEKIIAVHTESKQRYGSPRIAKVLCAICKGIKAKSGKAYETGKHSF